MITPAAVGFVVYLLALLLIGFVVSKKNKNMKDFSLGGGRLGPWVLALSERASDGSAWLLFGLPGAVFVSGLANLWTVAGLLTGMVVIWFVLAEPIRAKSQELNAMTLPDLLSRLHGDCPYVRHISSWVITFFLVFYVAAQFAGAAKLFNVSLGFSLSGGLILGALIIVVYTLMGGFLAVVWTDFVQALLMLVTLVVIPAMALLALGQSDQNLVSLASIPFDRSLQTTGLSFAGILGGLSWGLGYLGQPHLLVRFMALRNREDSRKGGAIAVAWSIPAFAGAVLVGLLGKSLISSGQLMVNGEVIRGLADPEKMLPLLANSLLDPWIGGLMMAGALAATMSTADSQLLVCSTVMADNWVHSGRGKDLLTRFNPIAISRMITFGLGFIACLLAWSNQSLVFDIVSYSWSGLGASIGPALLLSLFWKSMTKQGAIAGLLVGSMATIFDLFSDLLEARFTAFATALLACYVVSKIYNKMSNTTVNSGVKLE